MVVITLCKRVFSDIFRQICYLQVIEKLYKGTPKIFFSEERQNYFLEYIKSEALSLSIRTPKVPQMFLDLEVYISTIVSVNINNCVDLYHLMINKAPLMQCNSPSPRCH